MMGKKSRNPKKKEKKDNADKKQKSKQGTPILLEGELLEKANDTDYGLSSAIFTKDIDKAFHFARHIGAGMCHINGPTIHDEAHVPFGGNGESGVGREGTDADMEAMTELKWVTVQL